MSKGQDAGTNRGATIATVFDYSEVDPSIYVDLEGTQYDPPSLLGVLYPRGLEQDGAAFIQYVFEETLFPAANFRLSGTGDGSWCQTASAAWTFAHVLQLASGYDRHIVAWSQHELNVARECLDPTDFERFRARYINAIPFARKWRRKVHPGLVPPKSLRRGRNQLDWNIKLVGMSLPTAFGPGNTASRIRDVRGQLFKRAGDFNALTPVAKAKWTKLLKHNYFDCLGTREVLRVAMGDSDSA